MSNDSDDPELLMNSSSLPLEVEIYLQKLVDNSRRLAEFYQISSITNGNDLYFVASTETDRFIAKQSDEWKNSPLGFVIFWGNKKENLDDDTSDLLWRTDVSLVKTFDDFQQVLIYYSMKTENMTDWINLVVLLNTNDPQGWSEHPLHARAIKMSKNFFDKVYLYRGTLMNGLNSSTNGITKYGLVKKIFIDYRNPTVKRHCQRNEENSY